MSISLSDARRKLREMNTLLEARAWEPAKKIFAEVMQTAANDPPLAAEAWHGIAQACLGLGDTAGALTAYGQAHGLAPRDVKICTDFAKTLLSADLRIALKVTKRGLAEAPNDTGLLKLLVDIHDARYDFDAAIAACQRLAAVTPEPLVRIKLARLWMAKLDNARAAAEFRAVLESDPGNIDAMGGLADIWRIDGPVEEARRILLRQAKASLSAEDRAAARFKAALTQPIIARDASEIDEARARFAAALRAGPESSFSDPWRLGLGPNFYLAYQARDDRALQESLAAYYLTATPSLGESAAHAGRKRPAGRRLRVGVVSNFFSRHTVGYLTYGLVAGLDRARFEIVLFRTPRAGQDEQTQRFREAAPCIELPASLAAARAKIAEAELDVLHYPEIGMDHFSYFLAFARLAPLQTSAWGHPVTTGIPNMDLFLSANAMEPPGAQLYYTEKLVRLRGLSFAAERPAKPDGKFKHGIDSKKPAYLCPQSLFKVHHEFDATVHRLLELDRDGVVYFISQSANADGVFKERISKTIGPHANRVRLLPRTTPAEFMHLIRAADVVLDVPHWSGGKTSLEILSMGTPIVHQPGAFMRGRHTLLFYQRMKIDEPVVASPDAYAATAARLMHEQSFKKKIRGQIQARSHELFGNTESIREIEQVWTETLRERAG